MNTVIDAAGGISGYPVQDAPIGQTDDESVYDMVPMVVSFLTVMITQQAVQLPFTTHHGG